MTGNNLFKNPKKPPLEASVPRGNGGTTTVPPAHGREIYPKNISLRLVSWNISAFKPTTIQP